jgi:2-dehydro-3-deoxyphosphooctonate aldolase (KDO 8-P synthase)
MGEVLDIIQIPHSLSRYTEIIQAASNTGKQVSIKKGLFMTPEDALAAIKKVHTAEGYNGDPVILIERGNSFGYGDAVVDMRNLLRFNYIAGCIPCIDATHPAGDRRLAPGLAFAGVASGAHMVFMEVHNEPNNALCDGKSSIKLNEVKNIIETIEEIYKLVKKNV